MDTPIKFEYDKEEKYMDPRLRKVGIKKRIHGSLPDGRQAQSLLRKRLWRAGKLRM